MSPRALIIAGAVGVALAVAASTAEAKIECNKGFQMVQGSWLSTPYCRDGYVAEVANTYGFSASASQVRNDPLFKQRICRFIGQDIRIKEACDEVNPGVRSVF
jgi:hypothetical protein